MRPQGTFAVATNFETKIEWTLDGRSLVGSYADLLTFVEDNYIPLGFPVAVFDSDPALRGIYQCINNLDLSNPASWEKITGGGAGSTFYSNSNLNFSQVMPAKCILHNILIIPTNPVILHLGTTDGGDELYPFGDAIGEFDNVVLNKYFPVNTTIYITGINSLTQILIFYQDLSGIIT